MSERDGAIFTQPLTNLWARIEAEERTVVFMALSGPTPPQGFLSDGCTHCPDIGPTGEPLWMTCYKHDWWYSIACTDIPNTDEGRIEADALLLHNLQLLGLDELAALIIYRAVRIAGASHFKTS